MTDTSVLLIDDDHPASILAVADYLDALSREELGIAAKPHRSIVTALRARAETLIENLRFIELRNIVDAHAETLYDNLDTDLLVAPEVSWAELDDEARTSMRVTALTLLRRTGMITVDEDTADRLIASFSRHEPDTGDYDFYVPVPPPSGALIIDHPGIV